jgi:hypothetical protein
MLDIDNKVVYSKCRVRDDHDGYIENRLLLCMSP